MSRRQPPSLPPPHDAPDMPRLDQQLAALTRRWQGVAPMPPALSEAIEELPPTVEARRPMHAELTQRQQATREIQQRAQELCAGIPEASLVPDRHGLLLEANRTAAHLFHLDRPQLRGLPLAMGLAWEERRAFRTPLAWRQHGAEGRIRVQPPPQPTVPVAGHVAPARDGEGRLLGLRHAFPAPQGGQ
jgi:PAS domain-containing protein